MPDPLQQRLLHQIPIPSSFKIRFEVNASPSAAPSIQTGTNCQYCHNQKQTGHHELINTLHALLQSMEQTPKLNTTTGSSKIIGLAESIPLGIANSLSIQTFRLSANHFDKVRKHPSANGGVKHHEKVVSQHSHITVDMPMLPSAPKS